MNKKAKRFFRITFIILILAGFVDVLANFHYGTEEEIEIFHQPISVSGSRKFIVADNIYIGNGENSAVQVFNEKGEFLYGLRLPTSGGDFWMCTSEKFLFIYSVRNKLFFKLSGQDCIDRKKVIFTKQEEFYTESNLESDDSHVQISLSMLNKLAVRNSENNTKQIINIKAPLLPLSIFYGFLIMAIGMIGTFLTNGYFDKFLEKDNSVENNEVVKFFRNYNNKLK